MNTRERIIQTAVELFNDRGTAAVSTNHIAAAAGISPGNLYYHFRNKGEIIRAAFEQMDAYGSAEYERIIAERGPGTAEAVAATFAMIQAFNWRYRFFKRELTALVAADPDLKRRFINTHGKMLAMIRAAVDQSVEADVLREMPREEREVLADEIWLVTLFWVNYVELSGGEVTPETIGRGTDLLRSILMSRATRKGGRVLKQRSA